ncbi:DUF1722 domain-containing protein [Nitrosopumilus cobalaminigenes]|uniref:DUF1722 domain-containing protein n=1 Tax=Nitrosopumilus cobalaminigenes TaxID=1470066 RepID=A0A7D5LZ13_9ARCH|nr:YbgA family protein [Nitrosopumilus cobalaminigenes]QLH02713.1 DUF1722 domain-containing protein [Nitrosopumilus cobalaminigenes]
MSEKQDIFSIETQTITEKDVIDYVIERFEDVKKNKKINNLVSFQAINKYMIMAHNQEELKILGNLVASNKKVDFNKILTEYEMHLKKSLESEPTIKKHSNVILHIFGHFSNNFNQQEKEKFFDLLDKFKNKRISVGEILAEIEPIIYRFNDTYLASQTYFLLYSNPHPGNLFKLLSKKLY